MHASKRVTQAEVPVRFDAVRSGDSTKRWHQRVTEPSSRISDRSDRRTARLLSTLLLLLAPLGLLSAVLQLDGHRPGGSQIAISAAVVAILVAYGVSRTRYFRIAGALTCLIPTVAGLSVLWVDTADPGWFAFMALNPALATMLLPIRWSVMLVAANQVAVTVAVLLVDGLGFDLGIVAIMFNAIMGAVLLTAGWFRDRLEFDRRADLVARQRIHEAILAGTFGGIAIVRDDVIAEANASFTGLFASVHTDLRGARLDELFDAEAYDAVRRVADRADGRPVEITAMRRDGTVFDAEVLVGRTGESEDVSSVVAMRDITDRKQADETLFRAQRMESVGRLAAGLAHDTNNELFVISALADELVREHEAAGLSARKVHQIRSAAERISTLIRRVLLFGRGADAVPTLVDSAEFISDCSPMWRQALGNGVDLELALDHSGRVSIDRSRFEQVLLNLVINARDALDGTGSVRVGVDSLVLDDSSHPDAVGLPHGRYQRITISDSGEGIAAEHLPRIFDPFFTTKSGDTGTGLGLYTSRQIVRNSGGEMLVESDDGGTTVSVYLPMESNPLVDV